MEQPEFWWSTSKSYIAGILSTFAAAPDRDVIHWRARSFSGGDMIGLVTDAFLTLRERGIGPGDVVGILLAPNSPEMLTVRYATQLLGGAVCYLRTTNPGTKATLLPLDHQLQILRESGAVTIVADAETAERATELAERGDFSVTRVLPSDVIDSADVPDAAPWDPNALAIISYTSGSTGRPKGIRLAGHAWDATLRAWVDLGREGGCSSILISTPLSHGVAPMADAVLTMGAAIHLHEVFDVEKFVHTASIEDVSWTFMATNHVFQLIDHLAERGIRDPEAVATAGLSSLRRIVYGGSPAAPARIAQAFQLFGPVLAQGYATTESGRITTLTPAEHGRPELAGTVGRPFPEVQVTVCHSETGEQVAIGEIGEVRVRSPQMMDGYNDEPELTARALRDGWYFTGDIGCLDERGYLTLLGRVADVIKVHGVKVHPIVVEAEILAHPGVRHAAVYGVRDSDGSDHIHAALECDQSEEIDIDLIRTSIAEGLSPIHVPETINVLTSLPMNSNGKPDKVTLRAQAS